jgi:hypothetical protein
LREVFCPVLEFSEKKRTFAKVKEAIWTFFINSFLFAVWARNRNKGRRHVDLENCRQINKKDQGLKSQKDANWSFDLDEVAMTMTW